jgi:hypothetical protein
VSAAVDFSPGSLWSLLDLMQTFEGGRLAGSIGRLAIFSQYHTSRRGIMAALEEVLPKENFTLLVESAQFSYDELMRLNCSLSVIAAKKVLDVLNNESEEIQTPNNPLSKIGVRLPPLAAGKVEQSSQQLFDRSIDELSSKVMFSVSVGKAAFFNPSSQPFGAIVSLKFPSIAFEIDEAAKCSALERHTASVFHLMRAMETGLQAARRSIGIPEPLKDAERNWGTILRKFKDEIDKRNRATPQNWAIPENRSFFEEVYVSVDAVRNVWRNATMHVEAKYTPDEAEHVFNSVRGFMSKLASRLDETGVPLA